MICSKAQLESVLPRDSLPAEISQVDHLFEKVSVRVGQTRNVCCSALEVEGRNSAALRHWRCLFWINEMHKKILKNQRGKEVWLCDGTAKGGEN